MNLRRTADVYHVCRSNGTLAKTYQSRVSPILIMGKRTAMITPRETKLRRYISRIFVTPLAFSDLEMRPVLTVYIIRNCTAEIVLDQTYQSERCLGSETEITNCLLTSRALCLRSRTTRTTEMYVSTTMIKDMPVNSTG